MMCYCHLQEFHSWCQMFVNNISYKTSRISISPNGKIVAISNNKDIIFYSGVPEDGGKRLDIISNVHTDVITGLVFDAEGKWLISSGDKHVRVFFNVPGHLMQLEELKENKLKAKTEGMKQRIEEQIQSIKGNLEKYM